MDTPTLTCALCDQAVDGDAPAHEVRDKIVCEPCRRLVSACGPRQVLTYAGGPPRRGRRWLLVSLAAVVAVSLLCALLVLVVRQAAVDRARAEQMRAMVAEQQARAAAVQSMQARMAETQSKTQAEKQAAE